MTRLRPDHISGLGPDLHDYDRELHKKTGCSLKELALQASGLSEHEFALKVRDSLWAIVPMTSGQGVITGFSEAVGHILTYLGCPAQITSCPDLAGFAQAFQARADFIVCADDNDFICLNLRTRSVVHNNLATAKGYVAALTRHVQTIGGTILVLGCGRIGQAALAEILAQGFQAAVLDPDRAKVDAWYRTIPAQYREAVHILKTFPPNLDGYVGVLDATPVPDIIDPEQIHPNLVIAAPGVPLGVCTVGLEQVKDQVVHDPLQIGVAVMVTMSLALNPEP